MALSTMENIAIARIVVIGLAVAASLYAYSAKDDNTTTSHSRSKSASNRHSSVGGKTRKRR
jgi:hypothetical protein